MTRRKRCTPALLFACMVLLCALPAGAAAPAEGEMGSLTLQVELEGIDYLSELPDDYGVSLSYGAGTVSFVLDDFEEQGLSFTASQTVTGLEPGEYEISPAPEDHFTLASKGQNVKTQVDHPAVTVRAGGQAEATVTKTFSSIKGVVEKGLICIQAVDADDPQCPVEGAQFELYLPGKEAAEVFRGAEGEYTLTDWGVSVLSTDAEGRIFLEGLEPTEYRLQKSGMGTGKQLPEFYYRVLFRRSGRKEPIPSADNPDWYDQVIHQVETVVAVEETDEEPDQSGGAYLFPCERPTGRLTLHAVAEGVPPDDTVKLTVREGERTVGSAEYTGAELLTGATKTVREKEPAGAHVYTVEPVAQGSAYRLESLDYGGAVTVVARRTATLYASGRYVPSHITVEGRLTGGLTAEELPEGLRTVVLLQDEGAAAQPYRAELTGAALRSGGGTARVAVTVPADVSCAYAGWEAFLGEEPLPDGAVVSGGRLYRIGVDGGTHCVESGGELTVEVGVNLHTAGFRLTTVTERDVPLPGVRYVLSREGQSVYATMDGGPGHYLCVGTEPGDGRTAELVPDGGTGALAVEGLAQLGDYLLTPILPQGFEDQEPLKLHVDQGAEGLEITLSGAGVTPELRPGAWRLTARRESTTLTGEVILLGEGAQRATLGLKADGAVVTEADGTPRRPDEWTRSEYGWTFTYADLPAYAEKGTRAVYTVEPESPGGGDAVLQAGEMGYQLRPGEGCDWAVAFDGSVGLVWTEEVLSPAQEGVFLADFTRQTGGLTGLLDAPILFLHGENAAFGTGSHAISFHRGGMTGGGAWTERVSGAWQQVPLAKPVLTCRSTVQLAGVLEVVRRVEGLDPGEAAGSLDLLIGGTSVPFGPSDWRDGTAVTYLPMDTGRAVSVAFAGGRTEGLERTTIFSENVTSPDHGATFQLTPGPGERLCRLEVIDRYTPATTGGGFTLRAVDGSGRGTPGAVEGVSVQLADSGGAVLRFTAGEGGYRADPEGTATGLSTGPDGLVCVAGLTDGTYTLTAVPPGHFSVEGGVATVMVTGEDTQTAERDRSGRWTVRTLWRVRTDLIGSFGEGADGIPQVLCYKPVEFYLNLDGAATAAEYSRFTQALFTLTADGLAEVPADLDSDGAIRALLDGEGGPKGGHFPTDAEVTEKLAELIQATPERPVQTAEGRRVDPDLLAAGRYQVVWYALAEGEDCWRVEGVVRGGEEPISPSVTPPAPERGEGEREERDPAPKPEPMPAPAEPMRLSQVLEPLRDLFPGGDGDHAPLNPLRDILSLGREKAREPLSPPARLVRLVRLLGWLGR